MPPTPPTTPRDLTPAPPDTPVDLVLNPVKPSSRYDFVEIGQNRIPITNPIMPLIRAGLRAPATAAAFAFRFRRSIVIVAICLILAELGLRALEPRLLGRVYTNQMTAGHPVDMHPPGVRGGQIDPAKPPGTLRVLACGDSVTFGTGVPASSAWPAHLQSMLTQGDARPVEVMNTALPGADLREITASFDQLWRPYQPDRVVLVITGNIVSLGWIRRDVEPVVPPNPYLNAAPAAPSPIQRIAGLRHHIALVGAAMLGVESFKFMLGVDDHQPDPQAPFGVMLAHGYRMPAMDPAIRKQAWTIFERDLGILRDRVRDAGAELVVAYAPPRFAVTDRWRDNLKWVRKGRIGDDPVDHAATVCERLGIPFVDPREHLRDALLYKWPVYVIADYTHLDDAGHRALATAIHESSAELFKSDAVQD